MHGLRAAGTCDVPLPSSRAVRGNEASPQRHSTTGEIDSPPEIFSTTLDHWRNRFSPRNILDHTRPLRRTRVQHRVGSRAERQPSDRSRFADPTAAGVRRGLARVETTGLPLASMVTDPNVLQAAAASGGARSAPR
eukprot:3953030-Pyramimonas_sp.AAC.3